MAAPTDMAGLQQLADRLDIQDWFTQYSKNVDGHHWDAWTALYTEDAHLDYSSAGFAVGNRDEVCAALAEAMPALPMKQHFITNVDIEFDGPDLARVRAMFYNPMILPGSTEVSECGGYYHHEFVRTADGWRSRKLVEENLWFKNPPSA